MRYVEKYNFLYLSNPKSGSTSIRIWIDDFCRRDCPVVRERDKGPYDLHGTESHLHKFWPESLVWTTIRNPYAKVVSHYFYDQPDKNCKARWQLGYRGKCEISFGEYVRRHERLRTLSIDQFAPHAKLFPIERADKIGDWMEKIVGKDLPRIERLNTTDHDLYDTYYDLETRILVSRLFASDIRAGGYDF